MFEGRNFRIRHLSKNRFEFRSAYSVQYGTATEMMRVLNDAQNEAKRSAIELTLARQRLREAAAKDGTALEVAPAPGSGQPSAPLEPPTSPPPFPIPLESIPEKWPSRKPRERPALPLQDAAPGDAAPKRRIVTPHVTVVSLNNDRPRRRPNGLSYLTALREAEAAERSP
jgi:hypothetical protein